MLNPGDEVIIPEPCYVSYVPCVTLADGVPVTVNLKEENDFKLTKEQLLSAITPRTKILVLAFPNNPTGAVMTKRNLRKSPRLLRKRISLLYPMRFMPNFHTAIQDIVQSHPLME